MFGVTRISIISTAESALKRLKKAGIAVYGCKKRGARFIFGVKDKDSEKVFAIFSKACYNICIEKQSRKKRLFSALALRAGLALGALVFVCAGILSDLCCLKLEVVGSGAYLCDAVCEIVVSEGGGVGKPFSAVDRPLVEGRILSLPQVTFCNISKRGSVLVVDVEVSGGGTESVRSGGLVCDCNGTVLKISAVCGTAMFSAGDSVAFGDVLIAPYEISGEEQFECLAVGCAEIECSGTLRYPAPDDGPESVKRAYASLLLNGNEILSRSHTFERTESGVVIVIEFTYLRKLSLNMS